MKKTFLVLAVVLTTTATFVNAQSRRQQDNSDGSRWDNNRRARGHGDHQRDDRRTYDDSYNYNYNYRNVRIESMRLDELQEYTRTRLSRGIESGQITRREAKDLIRAMERIDEKVWRARTSRRISAREDREIREDLLVLNERIRSERSDRDAYNNRGGYARRW